MHSKVLNFGNKKPIRFIGVESGKNLEMKAYSKDLDVGNKKPIRFIEDDSADFTDESISKVHQNNDVSKFEDYTLDDLLPFLKERSGMYNQILLLDGVRVYVIKEVSLF